MFSMPVIVVVSAVFRARRLLTSLLVTREMEDPVSSSARVLTHASIVEDVIIPCFIVKDPANLPLTPEILTLQPQYPTTKFLPHLMPRLAPPVPLF